MVRGDPVAGCRGRGRRSPFGRRSWRVQRAGPGPEGIGMTPGVARRACVPVPGKGRARGSEVGEGDRGIDVDQRSLLSPSRSASNTDSATSGGPPRGGSDPGESAGVNQPFRTASASMASARTGLLVSRGGPISATTRPRSVTRTVSPPAASRTYSLSLLFKALIPTDRMKGNVATCSYNGQRTRITTPAPTYMSSAASFRPKPMRKSHCRSSFASQVSPLFR